MSWAEEQSWFGLEDLALEAGSDYDLDSTRSSVEFISIPAWRMRNGKLIAIKDMDTSHIKNCIKMINLMVHGDINISDTLKLNSEKESSYLIKKQTYEKV